MSATTKSTETDRPSIWMPNVNFMSPTCHHVHWRITGGTKCAASCPSPAAGTTECPNAARAPSAPPLLPA